MTAEESSELLLARLPSVAKVVEKCGGDPGADLWQDGLVVYVRIFSKGIVQPGGTSKKDKYLFKLSFVDYDEHAPRIHLCDPEDPKIVGVGKQFYPNIGNNSVFSHDTFFCMPGDRRCYEQGNHNEWNKKEYFYPELIIGSLFGLIHSPSYVGRINA